MGAILAASRFSQLASKRSYQETIDIWDLYCMTYYYRNCGWENVTMTPPDPPSFDKQYQEVHKCVTEQVEDLCRTLHNRLLGTNDQNQQSPRDHGLSFSLSVEKSSVDHQDSGQGVFITGSAVPGTVISFHPGLVYLPHHIRKMPNYPGMDVKSTYLISRYDGCIIDPNGFNTELKGQDNSVRQHPLAVGHMLNHPPTGKKPNVMPFSYDFYVFPKELLYLIPHRYYKEPGFLFKTQAIIRSLLYVTTDHVCNEELYVNYRLNPKSQLPEWYTPVDKKEDSRRWNT